MSWTGVRFPDAPPTLGHTGFDRASNKLMAIREATDVISANNVNANDNDSDYSEYALAA